MSRKKAAQAEVEAPVADGAEAKAPAAPKQRGPRGTEEAAKITVLSAVNPKRANSKAAGVFALYKDGMTIKEFADAVGKEATGHLVYDSKHGFISIEGYDPGAIVQPKPKKEPKPKAEKKVKPVKEAPAVDAEVVEETMS